MCVHVGLSKAQSKDDGGGRHRKSKADGPIWKSNESPKCVSRSKQPLICLSIRGFLVPCFPAFSSPSLSFSTFFNIFRALSLPHLYSPQARHRHVSLDPLVVPQRISPQGSSCLGRYLGCTAGVCLDFKVLFHWKQRQWQGGQGEQGRRLCFAGYSSTSIWIRRIIRECQVSSGGGFGGQG